MEAELLRAIRERPDDDEPRLVYADFLSERGDPRGELIVLQCKLARLDRDDDERRWMDVRMRALLDAHRATWRAGLDDIPTLGLGYLERGFVRRVALYEEPFVAHAESLLAAAPMLEAVYLRGTEWATPPRVPPELVQLREVQLGSTAFALAALASPYVENIECLQFASECDGPRIVEALARVRLPRLRSLDLGGTRAGRHGVAALLAWPGLAQLTHLDLSNCELDDVGELVGSPNIGKLELLSLAANPLGRRGALAVLTSPQLAALEELRLDQTNAGDAVAYATLPALATLRYSGNPLDADDAVALADARTLTALERLELGGANTHAPTVNAAAAAAILATQNLPALVAIDLGQNHFGPSASATMLRDMRAGLRSLGLAYTSLDQRGVGALASNPSAATLERLDISNNPLDSDAVELLARSPYLRPRFLHLGYTELGDAGVTALVGSPVASELRHLDLQGCNLSDVAVEAIARSPYLGHLTRLVLYNNRLTNESVAHLAASKRLPPLVELALGASAITREAALTLAAKGHGVR